MKSYSDHVLLTFLYAWMIQSTGEDTCKPRSGLLFTPTQNFDSAKQQVASMKKTDASARAGADSGLVQIPTREVRKVRHCGQTLLYAQDWLPTVYLSTAQHKHVGLSISPGADDVTASGWLCCWRRRCPFPLIYCQPQEALRAKSFDLFFNFVFLAIVEASSGKRSGETWGLFAACGCRFVE